jgi:hypothetical protein
MTASDLHRRLWDLGVRLSAVEGRLRVDAPVGVVTPEIRAALAEHKPAILAILTGRAGPPDRPARRSWRDLPNMSTGPRDYRKGDRWLPWHFKDGEGTAGQRGPLGSPDPRATHRHS